MGEWTKMAIMAVELLMVTLVLGFVIYLSGIAENAGEAEQKRIDSVAVLKEYRSHNQYDNNNEVYFPDIMELLISKKQTINVYVTRSNGTTVSFTEITPDDQYTQDRIYTLLYETNVVGYKAVLQRHPQDNELIIGYTFTAF